MVLQVIANIEIDVEELVKEIAKEWYDGNIQEVMPDDFYWYLKDNITYLENRYERGKWCVSDGSSIDGFADSKAEEKMIDVLQNMKGK